MSFYLDTNITVALLRPEPLSVTVDRWLRRSDNAIAISNFGAAEFSAVISRDVRMGTIDVAWANAVLADFDAWRASGVRMIEIGTQDIGFADAIVRNFETKLTVPDALHLAVAASAGLTLVTLDRRLIDAARMRGQPVAVPG